MKLKKLGIFLPFIVGIASAADPQVEKLVDCQGNTVIKVDNRIGAQTPFHAIFKIQGDLVTMVEGDSLRFSKEYVATAEISKPDRPGYDSANGNLFFYKASGRFEILKIDVVKSGLRVEETSGECKPFVKSSVFD